LLGIEVLTFVLIAIFTLGSAFFVYLSKSIMRSAIALAITFFGGSLAILFTGESILALMQLLIFVGGLSTYFIITLSLEREKSRNANLIYFSILAIVIASSLIIMFMQSSEPANAQIIQNGFLTSFTNSEENTYYLLYIIAFLPFAGAIGSIILIRRFVRALK